MNEQSFKDLLEHYRWFLKPHQYRALFDHANQLNDEKRREIGEKVSETGDKLHELYKYREKQALIRKFGLKAIENNAQKLNQEYKKTLASSESSEAEASEKAADDLIDNL